MAQLHVLANVLADNGCSSAAYRLSLVSPSLAFDKELNRALIKTDYFKKNILDKNQEYKFNKMFQLGVERFKFFMECGYTFDKTSLFRSIRTKNYNLTKYLISVGADMNAIDDEIGEEDETLLMFITREVSLKYLELFVENGADIHALTCCDATVLMLASWMGKINFMQYLIKKGADVNACNGSAYLNMFNSDVHVSALKILFTHGADINAKDEDEETVLIKACKHYECSYELLELLLKSGADVNAKDRERATPLVRAIKNIDCSAFSLELLLKHGAEINNYKWQNQTPLEIAVDCKRFDAVFLLLKYDLEMHGRKITLHKLFEYDIGLHIRNDIASWMIRNGADVNEIIDPGKQTPLIKAARTIDDDYDDIAIKLFNLLIDAGANVDYADTDGNTAFTYAAMYLRKKIVKLLARRGANSLLTESQKTKIIKYNGEKKSEKIMKTLKKIENNEY